MSFSQILHSRLNLIAPSKSCLPTDFTTPTVELFTRALGHADFHIRNECLSYLSEHPCRNEAHEREALHQLAIHGPDFYEHAHQATRLTLGGDNIGQLTELCQQWLDAGEDEYAARYLGWLITVEPLSLHEAKYALELFSSGKFTHEFQFLALEKLHKRLDERIELATISPSEAVERLQILTVQMAGSEEFPHTEWAQSLALVKRLCDKDTQKAGRALASDWFELDYNPNESGPNDWKLIAATSLTGYLQIESAAPKLMELLKADWEVVNEEVERALSQMNSPAVLKTIRDARDGKI